MVLSKKEGGGGLIQVPLILIYIEVLHSQPPFLRHAPFGLKREWVKEQAVSHGIASSKHKLEHKKKTLKYNVKIKQSSSEFKLT